MKNLILVAVFSTFGCGMAMLVTGCETVGLGPKHLVRYDPMTVTPIETKAPETGSYGLYSNEDKNPKVRVILNPGDTLGFKKDDSGKLFAIAGTREIPLNAGMTYFWKQE